MNVVKTDQKLDTWKNKLLDTGKRSHLLNYRDTQSSSLRIKKPGIFDLWEHFIINEHPIELPITDKKQREFEEGSKFALPLTTIVTNQTAANRQKTLRNLRSKAKTYVEEQDINVLYLSFGFLRWTEGGRSRQCYDAPLILIPVILTQDSPASSFILRRYNLERILNPALIHKLDKEFGLRLPEFHPKEEITAYFQKVKSLITKNGWKIIYEAGLSLLSFPKISIYHDLEKHRESIIKNPFIKAISNQAYYTIDKDLSKQGTIWHKLSGDSNPILRINHVDAGPQNAIDLAGEDISFIINCPSKSGKARTIAKLIAEGLAEDKKVLYVTENTSTLKAVEVLLNRAELDGFCMNVSNHRAGKKDILAQLGEALDSFRENAEMDAEGYRKMERLAMVREGLRGYSEMLAVVVEPLHKTIYGALNHIMNIQDYPNAAFTIAGIRETTYFQYTNYINALAGFSGTVAKMSTDYRDNPWQGLNEITFNSRLRHDTAMLLKDLAPKAGKLSGLCNEMMADLDIPFESSCTGLRQIIKIMTLAVQASKVPLSWMLEDNVSLLLTGVAEWEVRTEQYHVLKKRLWFLEEALNLRGDTGFLTIPSTMTEAAICSSYDSIKLLIEENPLYYLWQRQQDWKQVNKIFQYVEERITEWRLLQDRILSEYKPGIFNLDYQSIYQRFKTEYVSIFKIIKVGYKADKRLFQELHREPAGTVPDSSIIKALKKLIRLEQLKSELADAAVDYSDWFGDCYQAQDTDIDVLQAEIERYGLLREYTDTLMGLLEYMKANQEQESMLSQRYGTFYAGVATDWRSIRQALEWVNSVKREAAYLNHEQTFIKLLQSPQQVMRLCGKYVFRLQTALNSFDKSFNEYLKLFAADEKKNLRSLSMTALAARLEISLTRPEALDEWMAFHSTCKHCCSLGLEGYIREIEEQGILPADIIPVFEKRFYLLWVNSVLPKFPTLRRFSRNDQADIFTWFQDVDETQYRIAKIRAHFKLANGVSAQRYLSDDDDEVRLLKQELGKHRCILPIRRLFCEVSGLLLTVKPCLMMSPQSVSTFLDADRLRFDMVIFEGAVETSAENAAGAILRGSQIIVVGEESGCSRQSYIAKEHAS